MITDKLHAQIGEWVKYLQNFVDRLWYPPLIGFLALLDNIILIIPNDGILISSSMLMPKRWFLLALSVAVGSTMGAMALAGLVEYQGLPWILDFYPGIDHSTSWIWTVEFFNRYGLFVVFAIAISPFLQLPAVVLATLGDTPFIQLALVIFTGRFIKFVAMAYIGSHAPRLLSKMWGVRGELKDAGISLKSVNE